MMAAAAAPMEAQTAQPSSTPYPRWVMFEKDLKIEAEGSSCSTTTSGASKQTLAAARTSTGHLIRVSLRLTEPPGVSCVCLHIPDPDGLDDAKYYSKVIAAHGDSVLIEVRQGHTIEHFVYSAGAAAADPTRPPSLCLLPPFRICQPTGLVRRGEDVVVVGQLVSVMEGPEPNTPELVWKADLSLFRSGEWSVKRLQIRFRDASEVPEDPPSWFAVVPVRDGLICWVDPYDLGIMLVDVFEETPTARLLQYLPLPSRDNIWGPPSNRNVCATAGGDALKFVNIFPRCCCGDVGASGCERSCHAYTIETWTMRISGGNGDDDMEWVKDGVVDCTELWALDSYKGLDCFPLDHPVVSPDEPEVICFWLHEPPVNGSRRYRGYTTVNVLMVNTRSKTIHFVSRCKVRLSERGDGLIPSNVSCFFNSYPISGTDATFTAQGQEGIGRPAPAIIATNPMLQPTLFAEPSALEIFEAFQEIPSYGLDHDEVKVYRILRTDNCRQFRSLLRLPKNLRKDWLLMEIKASED